MEKRNIGKSGLSAPFLGLGTWAIGGGSWWGDNDDALSVKAIETAVEQGITWIDTAPIYGLYHSEEVVGEALRHIDRDKVILSTKCGLEWRHESPVLHKVVDGVQTYRDLSAKSIIEDVEDSLRRLGTDHLDVLYTHWQTPDLSIFPLEETVEAMMKLKEQGKIRFAGFSFHDRLGLFKEVVESAPWDFCLIQHNYLDYEYEAGCLGPKYAAANGMGLAVMKPVRTGFLANLPPSMRAALRSTGVEKPDTEWALDYLWDIPEVSVAVSGMGSMADVEANLRYASKAKPNMLTPDERKALGAAIRAFRQAPGHIDCTGCYQCIPCPHNVAIGYIFAYVYNNYLLHKNKKKALFDYTVSMSPIQRGAPASACVNCGACLAKCPQKLNIPELLKRVRNDLEA